MQLRQSRELSNLSNDHPPSLGSSWDLLDVEDPKQLQLFCGAAGLQLLQLVRKSKSQSQRCCLADERQTKKQRRVSFCLDQENHETLPNDSSLKLTDAECQALWWSPKELLAINHSALAICHYIIKSEQDYCRALVILVGICARSDTGESSLPATNPVLTCPQHGAARGFTDLITPTLPIRRRRSVQLVLQAQADMRNQVQCDRMLAAKYHYCSRYATVWARVLAEQDAACCSE
jgi:hypothetical protein